VLLSGPPQTVPVPAVAATTPRVAATELLLAVRVVAPAILTADVVPSRTEAATALAVRTGGVLREVANRAPLIVLFVPPTVFVVAVVTAPRRAAGAVFV
jgi:hypothetical protein